MRGVIGRSLRWFAIYAAIVVAVGLLFVKLPTGFVPNEDQGYFFVQVQAPPGATQQRTGVVLDDVAQYLLKSVKPKLFFINTVFHNPTATSVAPQIAFRLLQLAQQHDFTIVEDDIYADLQATPTQRLGSLDQVDHVIYVGGLSKTLSST